MSPLTWFLLAVAGGLGAVTRFTVDARVGAAVTRRRAARSPRPGGPRGAGARWAGIPLGTVVVNVTACLLLGLVAGWTAAASTPTAVSSVLGTGFLGGYSTFSTASVESARLLLARRGPATALHALGMAAASLVATVLGLAVGGALG